MIYSNTDPAWDAVLDRYKLSDFDNGKQYEAEVATRCELCGRDVYSDEEYYSDGDFDICDGCFGDFKRIDIVG